METWIIYVLAPIVVAVVSWILGKNGRRIDETSKLVMLLQDEIRRLTTKVEKLETKGELKDTELDRRSMIIQEAFRCRTPSMKCPVLIKQDEYNKLKRDNDNNIKGFEEQESGEYPPEYNEVQGGECQFRSGV